MIDYMYRIITGTCGRRATAQIWKRFTKIFLHILPTDWNLSGTVGLSDPSLNGKMAGACAVLMPVCDDHLQMETEWEDYRCDLSARVDGRLRMFVPVREAVLLFLNKDCRKLYKKLMKARSKFASRPPEEPPEENKGGTELTKTDQQD